MIFRACLKEHQSNHFPNTWVQKLQPRSFRVKPKQILFSSNSNLVEDGLCNTPDLTIFLWMLPAVLICPVCLLPSLEPEQSFFEEGHQGYHVEHQRTSEVKNPHWASTLNEAVVTHSHHFRRIINSSRPRDSLFIC